MRRTVTGIFFLSIIAPPLAAQKKDCLADLKMPPVGQWAEYAGVRNKKPYTLRYAVVGSEERAGKSMKWLELQVEGDTPDKNMVFKVLTTGTPAEMDQAEEIVFKPGNKPAMKMNPMLMGLLKSELSKNSALANLCEGVSLAGEESVTVPAGTFKALRYHNAKYQSDTWVVPDKPFVMVKATGKDFELNLTSSGDGAKSAITETPQDMPGMSPPK
jgi:hypothetical protein